MNKQDFLGALENRLSGIPKDDIEKSKEFYAEMIDDRIEEGLPEEEAVEALGSIDEIVSQILADTSLAKIVKEKVRPQRSLRAWEIALITIGSPIWLSLGLSILALVVSLYIIIWAMVVTVYTVDLAMFLTGPFVAVCGLGFLTVGDFLTGPFLIGCGVACFGISLLLFVATWKLTVLIAKFSKFLILKIKSAMLKRKGESDE